MTIIETLQNFGIVVAGFVATSAGIPAKLEHVIILFREQGSGIIKIVPTLGRNVISDLIRISVGWRLGKSHETEILMMLKLSSWKCFHKLKLDYEVESSNLEEDRAISGMLNTLHNVGYFTVRLIRIHLWAKNRFVSWVNINTFLGVHLRETLRAVT